MTKKQVGEERGFFLFVLFCLFVLTSRSQYLPVCSSLKSGQEENGVGTWKQETMGE